LALGKYWIENKIKANVLSIVTTYAWVGSGYVVPSACAKAGVLAMTRSLAVEWGKYGLRFNAIAPGPFPTKGAWDRLFPKEFMDKLDINNKIPVGRVGEHQELSNLAAYLMSDYSAYVNGDVITIDGGEWMQNGGEFTWVGNMIPKEMWDMVEASIKGKTKE
jgi:NAD(P)-dependent dehydrogenase (short-subunit alcohol dehydrogenase family)